MPHRVVAVVDEGMACQESGWGVTLPQGTGRSCVSRVWGCPLSGGEGHFALHFLISHWVLDTWSLRVSIARMKHHDKEQLGEERLHFSVQPSGHAPSLGEVRAEIQEN